MTVGLQWVNRGEAGEAAGEHPRVRPVLYTYRGISFSPALLSDRVSGRQGNLVLPSFKVLMGASWTCVMFCQLETLLIPDPS